MATKVRWWKIQEPADATPSAVAAYWNGDVLRRYVPGEGLVDWPPLATFVLSNDAGAIEITEAEAVKLMKAGVGEIPSGVDTASSRGGAETVPAPEGVEG
jgi:hypothetical protein